MNTKTIAPLKEIERRLNKLHRIEEIFCCADDQDWEYLLSRIGDGGRDRFWKSIITDLRPALKNAMDT